MSIIWIMQGTSGPNCNSRAKSSKNVSSESSHAKCRKVTCCPAITSRSMLLYPCSEPQFNQQFHSAYVCVCVCMIPSTLFQTNQSYFQDHLKLIFRINMMLLHYVYDTMKENKLLHYEPIITSLHQPFF